MYGGQDTKNTETPHDARKLLCRLKKYLEYSYIYTKYFFLINLKRQDSKKAFLTTVLCVLPVGLIESTPIPSPPNQETRAHSSIT